MSVLSLPTTGHTQVYVSGDVMIDETATIAPGVILQATANCRIIIRAGACIGMGTVITASDGSIEVGEGAILGAGVLLVGYGKIGDRACIGTASTLINTAIGQGELVTPSSLLGDSSRQENLSSATEPKESINSDDPWSNSQPPVMESNGEVNGKVNDHSAENNGHAESPAFSEFSSETNPSSNGDRPEETAKEEKTDPPTSPSQQSPTNSKIYGQTHIERLMVTLFPHKEPFKKNNK